MLMPDTSTLGTRRALTPSTYIETVVLLFFEARHTRIPLVLQVTHTLCDIWTDSSFPKADNTCLCTGAVEVAIDGPAIEFDRHTQPGLGDLIFVPRERYQHVLGDIAETIKARFSVELLIVAIGPVLSGPCVDARSHLIL